MKNIDPHLYETQGDYRELAGRLRASERENEALRAQLGKRWRTTGLSPWKATDYANQIPYQSMTQTGPRQWEAPHEVIRENFVVCWSKPNQKQEIVNEERRADVRRASHSTLRAAACASKQLSPVASLVFDTFGILTAGSLPEGIASIDSIIGTARAMDEEWNERLSTLL